MVVLGVRGWRVRGQGVLPSALKASVEKRMIRTGMRYCSVTTVR